MCDAECCREGSAGTPVSQSGRIVWWQVTKGQAQRCVRPGRGRGQAGQVCGRWAWPGVCLAGEEEGGASWKRCG